MTSATIAFLHNLTDTTRYLQYLRVVDPLGQLPDVDDAVIRAAEAVTIGASTFSSATRSIDTFLKPHQPERDRRHRHAVPAQQKPRPRGCPWEPGADSPRGSALRTLQPLAVPGSIPP